MLGGWRRLLGRAPAPDADAVRAALGHRLGPGGLLQDEASRAVYARDASHLELGRPRAVALPADADQAAAVVALCARERVPFVPRGGGTGLSGGALPPAGAVVIGTSRLASIGPVDAAGRRVTVGPGARNEAVSRAARPHGLLYAPDPSSQAAATIGGNVAENAGGPHTLKVGVTLHHLRRLEWVDAGGRRWTTGRGLAWERGLDLLGLLAGSEGTLGVVTAAELRLVPAPRAVAALLAMFPRLDDATAAVVALMGEGMLPAAVELIDRPMLETVEQAFHFGFATDQEAAMVVEFDGAPEAVAEDAGRAARLLAARGASSVRQAADEAERTELWRCRKRAFGAVGRLAPSYISMDVCVPLARLPDVVRAVQAIASRHGVRVATALHAGDGNLHPGVHYDARDPDLTRRAHAAADEIVLAALSLGGSVTGEHGVGVEKRHLAGRQIDRHAAALMAGIKRLFDPDDLCNPGKALPAAPAECVAPPPPPAGMACDAASLTVTAPAAATLAQLQAAALAAGLWIPCGLAFSLPALTPPARGLGADLSVAELVAAGVGGPALLGRATVRDVLLELWAETGDGRPFRAGAPVGKNVAGYDLVRLVTGSAGALARVQGATFQLKPAPEQAALWQWRLEAESPPRWDRLLAVIGAWESDLSGSVVIVEREEAVPMAPAADAGRSLANGAGRAGSGGVSPSAGPSAGRSAAGSGGDGAGSRGGIVVTVLTAGRERPWDLPRREEELTAWAPGGRPTARLREPFADASRLALSHAVPSWARDAADWTVLARDFGAGGGPDRDTPAGAWPTARRLVWQSSPELIWLPAPREEVEDGETPPGWHAEAVWRAGRLAPLPEPPAGVPRALLRGLKVLFDPGGRYGGPSWLLAGDEVRDA